MLSSYRMAALHAQNTEVFSDSSERARRLWSKEKRWKVFETPADLRANAPRERRAGGAASERACGGVGESEGRSSSGNLDEPLEQRPSPHDAQPDRQAAHHDRDAAGDPVM